MKYRIQAEVVLTLSKEEAAHLLKITKAIIETAHEDDKKLLNDLDSTLCNAVNNCK